jgi:hypothetical protein
MIWFDALLDRPVDDETLQRGIAATLAVALENVVVAHSIAEIGTPPVTCVVEPSTADAYSQVITIYLSEPSAHPDTLDSASRLAKALDRSMLVSNDETANPYSFVHISNGGQRSVVLVDHDELDEHDRYLIL